MPERVDAGRLVDAGVTQGALDCPLKYVGAGVMSALEASSRIDRSATRRENVLPRPFAISIGILAIERKWQVAGSALAIAVFGLLFAQQTGAVPIIVLGILITMANNWLSFSFHAYQAELYPTRIRAQAVGFVYSWSRFSVIFTSFIIAWVLHHYDVIGVFVFIAAAMIGVFLIIGIFGPRTNNLRLEEIAA